MNKLDYFKKIYQLRMDRKNGIIKEIKYAKNQEIKTWSVLYNDGTTKIIKF